MTDSDATPAPQPEAPTLADDHDESLTNLIELAQAGKQADAMALADRISASIESDAKRIRELEIQRRDLLDGMEIQAEQRKRLEADLAASRERERAIREAIKCDHER